MLRSHYRRLPCPASEHWSRHLQCKADLGKRSSRSRRSGIERAPAGRTAGRRRVVRRGSKPVWFPAFLHGPIQQDDPTNHRNEVEQQKPAALVDIVKPANADGDARQQERQGKHRGQLVTDDSGRRSDQHHEQEPPPVFGTGSTPREVSIL